MPSLTSGLINGHGCLNADLFYQFLTLTKNMAKNRTSRRVHTAGHGKSWNLGISFSGPGKSCNLVVGP